MRHILLIGGLISAFALYAQEESPINPVFQKSIKRHLNVIPKSKRQKEEFRKAYAFYLSKNNDSTIVYAGRYLTLKSKDRRLANFARFFLADGLYNKQLYDGSKSELLKVDKSFPLYAVIISRMSNIQMILSEHEKAIESLMDLKNSVAFEEIGIQESAIDHNLGVCYMFLGDYEESERFLFIALEKQKVEADTLNLIGTYGDIANLYYEQYRDEEAIPFFIKAYELATKTNDFEMKQRTALNMAVVEENRGDFEKSIAYRKEYDQWKDSLNNQQKVWRIAQLEKKHIAETKQREIGLLQRENELKAKQRNWILIGAGILLFVLVFIVYFYWQKIRASAIIAEQRESLDKLNSFKNRLFSIVSHDLRSSVHGLRRSTEQLRNEIPEEDSNLKTLVNQQGAIANSTYGMLDNLLNWALLQSDEIYFQPEKVSLKRLMPQVILNYQPLLDQKKIAVHLNIPTDAKVHADVDSTKIVLRNVLDNAIKFTPEGGKLYVDAKVEEDTCLLSIKDSGPGMTPQQLEIVVEQSSQVSKESDEERSGTGLGVRLCASFMLKNNGSFQMESEVGKGTTVNLTFEKA
ncbi:MAG: tetratricopeptide repeat protein [Crocinitomicaceae bacterium]